MTKPGVGCGGGQGTGMACAVPSPRRESLVRDFAGIDTVEADGAFLIVLFFGKMPDGLTEANVRVEGGRRVRGLNVLAVEPQPSETPDSDSSLKVTLDREGDFSAYTLRLVNGPGDATPPSGLDPRYAAATFRFHPDCPTDADCADDNACPPDSLPEPALDYLAKDFASFRQLLLERFSLIMPEWKERHLPDVGIAVVEVLAYAGDYLSYYQDAVATEAYLHTARQRISVRRHARLVDYILHEGCNARAFVRIEADEDVALNSSDYYFITLPPELKGSGRTVFSTDDLKNLPWNRYTVFEPMGTGDFQLRAAHNRILFYTWGDEECCLPKGATRATLLDEAAPVPVPPVPTAPVPAPPGEPASEPTSPAGTAPAAPSGKSDQPIPATVPEASAEPAETPRVLNLCAGDLLIFEETLGPHTGNPADADPSRRHAVRLTCVTQDYDPVLEKNVLEIEWAVEDTLPFPFCLSSALGPPDCRPLEEVSVARGNVLVADHGRRVAGEDLGTVEVKEVNAVCRCDGSVADEEVIPAPFGPSLYYTPLVWAEASPPPTVPAARLIRQDPHKASPWVALQGVYSGGGIAVTRDWSPRPDLLDSGPGDADFCVETDNDGRAHLRFGDGSLGDQPEAGTAFAATYRVGGGPSGNVGAESLTALVFRQKRDGLGLRPTNPLPATGGTAPEPMEAAKQYAPHAFRAERRRAVIPQDFADFAQQDPRVQRAASDLRWAGSWYEARTAVDALGLETPDAALLSDIEGVFARVRRMGWDAVAVPASLVPLDLELTVCVRPEYVRAHVVAALRDRFSDRILPDGTRGFFHPDNLTFGAGVAVSRIVAAAQGVPGVLSAQVTRLNRWGEPPQGELENGVLPLGGDEVAELTADPDYPERGRLSVLAKGGR